VPTYVRSVSTTAASAPTIDWIVMETVKLNGNQAWLAMFLTLILLNVVSWTGAAIQNAIDVNTCITAQGEYLDETDYEDCGYKP
jgi:hypothetical protein